MGAFIPTPGQPNPMQPGEFISAAIPNFTTFGFSGIGPPSPLYIQRDDQLFVSVISANAGDSVVVNARELLAPFPRGGQPGISPSDAAKIDPAASNIIEPVNNIIAVPTAYTLVTQQVPLSEGYLLAVTARPTATFLRGQCFVHCFINRGPVTSVQAFQTLFSDYVGINHPVGWPGGPIRWSSEFPGIPTIYNPSNPAAGADWTFTVPASRRWRVQSINAQLQTSATVANRIVRLQIVSSGAVVLFQSPPSAVIPASTTAQVSAGQGQITSTTDPSTINATLPGLLLMLTGQIIRTNTTNIQVGDQWSSINIFVEEVLDF